MLSIPDYEILGELGQGGMGVVSKAFHRKLQRVVALKMLRSGSGASDADLARFHTEARAVAALQHPNIVQVYEIGEYQGSPFLALEFVSGGSLKDRLKTRLPQRQAAELVHTLAGAMASAHEGGHRRGGRGPSQDTPAIRKYRLCGWIGIANNG